METTAFRIREFSNITEIPVPEIERVLEISPSIKKCDAKTISEAHKIVKEAELYRNHDEQDNAMGAGLERINELACEKLSNIENLKDFYSLYQEVPERLPVKYAIFKKWSETVIKTAQNADTFEELVEAATWITHDAESRSRLLSKLIASATTVEEIKRAYGSVSHVPGSIENQRDYRADDCTTLEMKVLAIAKWNELILSAIESLASFEAAEVILMSEYASKENDNLFPPRSSQSSLIKQRLAEKMASLAKTPGEFETIYVFSPKDFPLRQFAMKKMAEPYGYNSTQTIK